MKWVLKTSAPSPPPCEDGLPAGELRRTFVERATVTVRQLALSDGRAVVVKRYFFPTAAARLRGALRHSWLGAPKPRREAENLLRLRAAGVSAPEPLAWAWRRDALGFVRDGWLMTPYLEGAASFEERLLAADPPPAGPWRALGAEVRRAHDAGCWYRNLCARNVLLQGEQPFLIDPAKSRWQGGPVHEAHALADLLILLAPWGDRLGKSAWEAFFEGYGRYPGARRADDLHALLPAVARSPVEAAVLRERVRLSPGR